MRPRRERLWQGPAEKAAAHPRPWGRDRREASLHVEEALSVARPGRGTRDRHTKLLSAFRMG